MRIDKSATVGPCSRHHGSAKLVLLAHARRLGPDGSPTDAQPQQNALDGAAGVRRAGPAAETGASRGTSPRGGRWAQGTETATFPALGWSSCGYSRSGSRGFAACRRVRRTAAVTQCLPGQHVEVLLLALQGTVRATVPMVQALTICGACRIRWRPGAFASYWLPRQGYTHWVPVIVEHPVCIPLEDTHAPY